MKKVGVTGGMGCGKTTVCRLFHLLGIPIYDSDRRAKELMNRDPKLRKEIISLLGEESYTADGVLNRPYVAARVFAQSELLERLNGWVHPAVQADFQRWAEEQQAPYVIEESAILFEAGADRAMDAVVAVTAPVEVCIHRASQRDGATEESVRARIARQMGDEERIRRSDFRIDSGEDQLLMPQVLEVHQRLIDRWNQAEASPIEVTRPF